MKRTVHAWLTAGLMVSVCHAQNIALDTSFDPGQGPDSEVRTVAIQADGKILVGGIFDEFNGGLTSLNAVRLNTDGSLDNTFDPPSLLDPVGVGGTVRKIVIQNDGKILLAGGVRRTVFPITNMGIIRLNSDGSLDNSFDLQGEGFDGEVLDAVIQPDGKIIVCGGFDAFNGSTAPGMASGIARLNSDGSLDAAFNPGSGFDLTPEVLALQADGKILVGGRFETFNGSARVSIVRLNGDGTLDASFDPGSQFTDDIRSIGIQADGKILVGGNLKENFPFGVIRPRIARLNADGSTDNSFDPGDGFDSYPQAFHIQADGKIIVAGEFGQYQGTTAGGIIRLHSNGDRDTSFNTGAGFGSTNPGLSMVKDMKLQADGKIYVVGNFNAYDGTNRNRIARLLGDGGTTSAPSLSTLAPLKVFPNPSQGVFTVECSLGNSTLKIIDVSGKVLWSTKIQAGQNQLSTTHLPKGVYLLQILGETEIGYQRLVLE